MAFRPKFKKITVKKILFWVAWVVGFFVLGSVTGIVFERVEVKWNPPRNYAHCSAQDVDEYYFQKLETFVDPRDSNEYTVLKYAGYKGCLMSEFDSGFVAGDTVTFHLMLENLRFKTKCSTCLDSTCERGRYYSARERDRVCPAGWTIASARQNAGLFFGKGGKMVYWPTFSPVKTIDVEDPSGLRRLRSRPHDGTVGLVDTVDLNLSGYYDVEKESFVYVDSLSVVWTMGGFASVIVPNRVTEEEKAWVSKAMVKEFLKPEHMYPIRCIRIDDPKHIMDRPESGMTRYYNNMQWLPYLYR